MSSKPAKKNNSTGKQQYIELYKKYRPRTWDEVIGQDNAIQSLRRVVADDRLPTAYLFSGPRGTGKTSTAKIFAKAINCEHPDGNGNPCNECGTCMSIDDGTCTDYHYISAANNGSVDEVRRFMDQARRASSIRKPVWVIDEVHRLSNEAFDSMLIPLEDVDMPALFIFCTTQPKKIPATLLSRLFPISFGLVQSDKIDELCQRVLQREGYRMVGREDAQLMAIEDEELPFNERRKVYSHEMILKAIRLSGVTVGGGSVRQVLSSLDYILSNPTQDIRNWNGRLANDVFNRNDIPRALLHLSQALASGDDARDLTNSLLDTVRELVILEHTPEQDVDPSKLTRRKSAIRLGDKLLLFMFKRLGEACRDQLTSEDARIYLELALIDIGTAISKTAAISKAPAAKNTTE